MHEVVSHSNSYCAAIELIYFERQETTPCKIRSCSVAVNNKHTVHLAAALCITNFILVELLLVWGTLQGTATCCSCYCHCMEERTRGTHATAAIGLQPQ